MASEERVELLFRGRYAELTKRRKRLEEKGDLLNAALVDVRRAELLLLAGSLRIEIKERNE